MIEIICTVTIENFRLMTFILENVLFAFNYFIGTNKTTESLMTTGVSATITSGMSTPVQLSTTTPVGGSSARSTVEKLSTQTTASINSPRMTTSRISEKSSPTQPSVPATTGKQRIYHLSKSFVSYCH
jgi:hypothetical protein